MKKEITIEKYDLLCERFANAQFKCGKWWPTIEEIKQNIEPKLDQNLEFLIWITETADKPMTDEQKASRTYINNLINKTLRFVD